MDTAPLKSFATRARTDLIAEVSAGIRRVLAPASPERVEQPGVVAALEKAVDAAGGGETGRAAVADKVAYTWFNRIIALRFMDANGYTGVGVVSPARGQAGGQPEILAEAKRGTIDTTVVTNKSTIETVTGLLDGTRRSDDPQGEAYALLLAEYCRYWNRAMPFMFEREGDYTELLIPANLLADDSVLARAVARLTEDVCRDVEVIGWLYQFYIAERKDEVFAGFKKNKKAGAAEIPAATQLFTPHWIVRYLVENSLGRLWLLNRPTSRLADRMEYYIKPVDEETDFLKVTSPEELKVIDPACGSGHMLTSAFDLLYAIYQEEGYAPADIPTLILTNNLYGVEIDPRAGTLAAFALTMKARARQRAYFTKGVQPNICVLDPVSFTPAELDLLLTPDGDRLAEGAFWNQFQFADIHGSLIQPRGSMIAPLERHLDTRPPEDGDLLVGDVLARARRVLVQASYLSARHHIIVTNPPYMGTKNMDGQLVNLARTEYSETKSDLFAMFIQRSQRLGLPKAYLGFMTPFVWMFISSYAALRRRVSVEAVITSLIQLEYSGFDDATVPICCFTMKLDRQTGYRGVYIRLSDFVGPSLQQPKALEAIRSPSVHWRFVRSATDYAAIPGAPIVYWAEPRDVEVLKEGPRVSDYIETREGLTTGDNDRFLRRWYEVSARRIAWSPEAGNSGDARWFLYVKGGEVRRWFGNLEYVVDWENNGERQRENTDRLTGRVRSHNYNGAYAFREGLTWSGLSSSHFSVRYVPAGLMFDAKGPMGFARQRDWLLPIIGLLNSNATGRFMRMLAPTLDFKLGHVLNIPVRLDEPKFKLLGLEVAKAIDLAANEWNSRETAFGFTGISVDRSDRRVSSWVSMRITESAKSAAELGYIQNQIDHIVDESLGYGGGEPSAVIQPTDSANDLDEVRHLISYFIGCMFGRYSLDKLGLILASQGSELDDYLAMVPDPSFTPDADNVLPIVDGDWFEDDIVARFRTFLRVAFGEQHFEENLRFVTEALGVNDLREYFLRSFYKDHVQRYRKRPIYWLFSSPKGSFNALIYMHRYTPTTVSTVLNEYLREFKAKLEASRQHHERLAAGGGTPRQQAAALKEVDRLRKVLLELEEYEHDVLYPLATRQVTIDLDDGVKANYPKFGAALKKIPGLEASDE